MATPTKTLSFTERELAELVFGLSVRLVTGASSGRLLKIAPGHIIAYGAKAMKRRSASET